MANKYNDMLKDALLGKTLKIEHRSKATPERSVISFMGEALGFPEGDVHCNRFYRIQLTLSPTYTVTDVRTLVDGELISPCSGYFPEVLDEFDYPPVLQYCLKYFE